MAKVDGLLSYEVYIICVIVSHQPQPQLSHQLLFQISPPEKKHRKYMEIHRCQYGHRPFRLNIPSSPSSTSSPLPSSPFCGYLIGHEAPHRGMLRPRKPRENGYVIWALASRGKLDHHCDYSNAKLGASLPGLIQSWRICHGPLAAHKQSIPCRVCRK